MFKKIYAIFNKKIRRPFIACNCKDCGYHWVYYCMARIVKIRDGKCITYDKMDNVILKDR